MVGVEQRKSGLMLPLNADFSTLSPETHATPADQFFFTENWNELLRNAGREDRKWFYIKEFGLYAACPQEYKVEKNPVQHRDEKDNVISGAFYYIDEYFTPEGDVIYLSYLPPHKMTSEPHRHSRDMFEHYKVIRGNAVITLGYDMKKKIPLDDYIRIPFGMGHQMQALDEGVLTLIRTENPHRLPPGKLHIRD